MNKKIPKKHENEEEGKKGKDGWGITAGNPASKEVWTQI